MYHPPRWPRALTSRFSLRGNEAEWAALGREKREGMAPPPDTPVGELLRRGQHLSAQAAKLLRAVERADGAGGP